MPDNAQIPALGRIVILTIDDDMADAINRRREHAREHLHEHRNASNGVMVHVGNGVTSGNQFPMMITKVWGDGPGAAVNGQVFLDGNDVYWATSVSCGPNRRQFHWPVRDVTLDHTPMPDPSQQDLFPDRTAPPPPPDIDMAARAAFGAVYGGTLREPFEEQDERTQDRMRQIAQAVLATYVAPELVYLSA